MSELYTVADYLFDRVHEAGATEVFGVPGDFNLVFLDRVVASKKVRWVGNTNELNAGYTADGYARERGFAAMVTTFGVGELSAINAMAGSFTEYVPVLHIVGAPSRQSQATRGMLHHTLGDGKFNHFMNMAAPVSVAQARLTPENAAAEIDRVIRTILQQHRPGYIMLPSDVAQVPIYPPTHPLVDDIVKTTSQAALDAFESAAREFLEHKKAIILADLLMHRLGVRESFHRLIDETDLPYATLGWGKTLLDESSPRWVGTYAGAASKEPVRIAVEEAERLIEIGVLYTDNTTAGFSQNIDPQKSIILSAQQARIGNKRFAPLDLEDSVNTLQRVLTTTNVVAQPFEAPLKHQQQGGDDEPLKQIDLWPIVAEHMESHNMLFAEQGTAYFGLAPVGMPRGVTFYAQPMWGSIGYTLPASLGAGLASPQKRIALAIGDGSALLTLQEISAMIREQIHPVILIVNNNGYTVERAIHGPQQPYNDIPQINWQQLPAALGADASNSHVLQVRTPHELRAAFETARKCQDKLVLIEIMMDKDDVPPLLAAIAEALTPTTPH